MRINAHAKLNLALAVTGRRADGYHTLDMVMREISLADLVDVEKADCISVSCGIGIEQERNTAYRAAKLFFERTGLVGGARIAIRKNIPSQAGLGGGSSDAAVVLKALNELYGAGLSVAELEGIGVKIGADVPFFIRGGCARARGIGEELGPVQDNCNFQYLLVKPECGVDTAKAFSAYHEQPKTAVDVEGAIAALRAGDAEAYFRRAANALYPAAKAICPAVAGAVEDCLRAGARFAMMTGSGSCVFAVFPDDEKRRLAEAALRENYPFVCCTEGS